MHTSEHWKEECQFISRACDERGNLKEFNYDINVFRTYCVMQQNDADRKGFHDAATFIGHCIDDIDSMLRGDA